MSKAGEFFKNAFNDMKESAREQHEVDKANFAAAKAEYKAQWEEAKTMGRPAVRRTVEHVKREEQITEANARIAAVQQRINAAKGRK